MDHVLFCKQNYFDTKINDYHYVIVMIAVQGHFEEIIACFRYPTVSSQEESVGRMV